MYITAVVIFIDSIFFKKSFLDLKQHAKTTFSSFRIFQQHATFSSFRILQNMLLQIIMYSLQSIPYHFSNFAQFLHVKNDAKLMTYNLARYVIHLICYLIILHVFLQKYTPKGRRSNIGDKKDIKFLSRSFRQLLVHFKVIEDPGAAQHMGDQEYNSLHAG